MYAIQLADKRFMSYDYLGWKISSKLKSYNYKFKAEKDLQNCLKLVDINIKLRTDSIEEYNKTSELKRRSVERHLMLIKELESKPYAEVYKEIEKIKSAIKSIESRINHPSYDESFREDTKILQEAKMILALNPQVIEL